MGRTDRSSKHDLSPLLLQTEWDEREVKCWVIVWYLLLEGIPEVQRLTWTWRLQLYCACQLFCYRIMQLPVVTGFLVPSAALHRHVCGQHLSTAMRQRRSDALTLSLSTSIQTVKAYPIISTIVRADMSHMVTNACC